MHCSTTCVHASVGNCSLQRSIILVVKILCQGVQRPPQKARSVYNLKMPKTFVHLHLHSEYSLVNSMIRLPALVDQTRTNQMPAVALTDMNNLYGAVKFFNKCVAQGIKPIIGAEVYLENPDQVICQNYCLVVFVRVKCTASLFYKNNGLGIIRLA